MKIGLIGLGHVAGQQLAAIERLPALALTDVYDADPAKTLPGTADAVRHVDLDGYLAHATADVHLVSTPTQTHFEIAMRLLDGGRRVCVEKPACLERAQLAALAARGRRGFLHVAFHAAFASDLEFWVSERERYELGRLVGFDCGFFDPYVVDGAVVPAAASLVGSWVDSGINALSVLARLVDLGTARVMAARPTRLPSLACEDASMAASFLLGEGSSSICGTVATGWTLGINAKATTLVHEHGIVRLDHTNRRVSVSDEAGRRVLYTDAAEIPRLQQHYEALFADLVRRVDDDRPNLEAAIVPHRLLIEAAEADPRAT